MELLCKTDNGVEKLVDVHVKRHDRSRIHHLSEYRHVADGVFTAQVKQTQYGRNVQHIDHRAEYAEHQYLTALGTVQLGVSLVKLAHFAVFAVENLRNLHPGQVFRQKCVHCRSAVFYLSICSTAEPTENDGKQHYKWHKAQHHQRQHVVDAQHSHKHAYNDKAVFDEVGKHARKHHRYRSRIVGNARDKRAYWHFGKLRMGQTFDVGKCVLSQSGNNALSRLLQHHRLHV